MSRPKRTFLLAVLALLMLGAAHAAVSPALGRDLRAGSFSTSMTAADAIAHVEGKDGILRFDVAEDGTRFVLDGVSRRKPGQRADAAPFERHGYIYPEGALTAGNGVNADGSPEFPHMVLGQLECRGWYLGGGDPRETAEWLCAHLFSFGEVAREVAILSEGYRFNQMNITLAHTMDGRTRPVAEARGVHLETRLGLNASHGANMRYEVRLIAA